MFKGLENSFNSKLVRLKVSHWVVKQENPETSFNSKLVRLKVAVKMWYNIYVSYVSIPNWCD